MVQQEKKDYDLLFSEENAVLIGSATCGNSAGAQIAKETIESEMENAGYDAEIIDVGCIGLCYAEPIIMVLKPQKPAIIYGNVTKKAAKEIAKSHVINGVPLPEYALGSWGEGEIEGITPLFEQKSMKMQERRILRNCGFIDPTNIGHYLAQGGYSGFHAGLRHGIF